MRILHLEDDLYDAILVQRALRRQGMECDVRVVASRAEYLKALETGGFSVILSDSSLPDIDNAGALALAHDRYPEVPFLLVSGHIGDRDEIDKLKRSGVADCISKSNLEALASSILFALTQRDENRRASTRSTGLSDRSPDVLPGTLPNAPDYTQAMERLVTVVQELSLARDLESIMRIVRTAARELTGADGATFVLREGDLCHYADEDAIAPLWKGLRFPLSACISGWAMLNRAPAVIEDIYADPRIPHDAYRPTFVKSLVMVPIRTLDPIGAIGNYWALRHQPSPESVKLLQALADTTAVALENVRVYAELEQRVKDRTAELQAANKELEAFSYAISHDLRAPLRHIQGFAQMLVEDCSATIGSQGLGYLDQIRSVTQRMTQMIDDLLALSRTTRLTIQRETTDLSRIAREIVSSLHAAAPDRQVEIVIADDMIVQGDARLLRVALENLLSNAWKFTSRKAVARIEFSQSVAHDGQTVYCIRDNGAGFDMAHADKLFGVFQRLHSDTAFPGTGIGLATVQRVIHKHGGKIWAESAIDQGTAFHFTLG